LVGDVLGRVHFFQLENIEEYDQILSECFSYDIVTKKMIQGLSLAREEWEHPTFAKIAKSPVFHLDKHTSNSRLHSLKQYSISLPKFGAFVQFA